MLRQNQNAVAENNNLMNLLKLSKKKKHLVLQQRRLHRHMDKYLSLMKQRRKEHFCCRSRKQKKSCNTKVYKKEKRSYSEIYKDLPVEEVIYDISENDIACRKCGEKLTFLKYETRCEIKIVPTKVTVVE